MTIFATQLQERLHRHNKRLGSLYTIQVDAGKVNERPISPYQIDRLKRAVAESPRQFISVALNPDELEAVYATFGFDPEDVRHVRLALLAEAVWRLLLGRVSAAAAAHVSVALFRLLLDTDEVTLAKYDLDLDAVRADPDDLPAPLSERAAQITASLEPAVELYEEALLWLGEAQRTQKQYLRQGYARMAEAMLAEADTLLRYPPGILIGTQEQADWQALITRALNDAHALIDDEA